MIASIAVIIHAVYCPIETCKYLYRQQPGKASCNPETPLPLELRCQVMFTDNDSFTIQWHYSNSSSPPSVGNSTSLETVLENKIESGIMIEIEYDTNSQLSVLRLTNYSETASGHYWCTVNTTQPTLNPSHVINVNICLFPGKTESEELNMCSTLQVDLFEDLAGMLRCADNETLSIGDIEKVQLGSMCAIEDLDRDVEESTTTVIDLDQTFSLLDQSPTSPATSGFPMRYIWMIVGIAFGVLIIIIIIMLAAIIYLNHKKNKIRGNSIQKYSVSTGHAGVNL